MVGSWDDEKFLEVDTVSHLSSPTFGQELFDGGRFFIKFYERTLDAEQNFTISHFSEQ